MRNSVQRCATRAQLNAALRNSVQSDAARHLARHTSHRLRCKVEFALRSVGRATETLSADGQARVCAEYVSQAYRRVVGKPGTRAGRAGQGCLLSMDASLFHDFVGLVSV